MNIKELGTILSHMEDAGFTHRELNNERIRKAALHLMEIGRRTTSDRECEWKCDDIDNGIWESACGETWSFIDGGPVENRMLFCHRCGGKLKTAPTSDKGGAQSQPFSLTEDDPQEGVAFQYANELVAKRLRGDKGGA